MWSVSIIKHEGYFGRGVDLLFIVVSMCLVLCLINYQMVFICPFISFSLLQRALDNPSHKDDTFLDLNSFGLLFGQYSCLKD